MHKPLKFLPRGAIAALALLPMLAVAADVDGSKLSPVWGVPFAGILLSIALMPLLAPAAWRDMFRRLLALSDGQIRFVGLSLVVGGLLVGLLMA